MAIKLRQPKLKDREPRKEEPVEEGVTPVVEPIGEDSFSLISRLYPSFPGLKREGLQTEIERLSTFAATDPEGFLFDLNVRANPEEREAVLRALGVSGEDIASIETFGAQQELSDLALAVLPELESFEAFINLVENDPDSFIDMIRTGEITQEKTELLQLMGFESDVIDSILDIEKIFVEIDGVRQRVSRTPDNSLYDANGNWVGFYNWSDGTVFNPYKAEGLGQKALASLEAGIGDILSISSGVASRFGYDDAASKLAGTGAQLQRSAVPTSSADFQVSDLLNPEFYATKIVRTIPFALSLAPLAIGGYFAGAGLAATLGLGAIWTAVIGGLFSAALTRPLESALEAGGSYNDAIARGKTEEEANAEFDEVFRNNLTLVGADAFEIAIALAPTPKWVPSALVTGGLVRTVRIGGKVIIVGLSEGGEEVYQDLIQRRARGEEFQFDPISKEVFAIGFVMGAGMGLGGDVISGIVNSSRAEMSSDMRKQLDESIARFKQEGLNQSESELRALDEIMQTPEGEALVNQAIEEAKTELPEVDIPQLISEGRGIELTIEQVDEAVTAGLISTTDVQLFEQQKVVAELGGKIIKEEGGFVGIKEDGTRSKVVKTADDAAEFITGEPAFRPGKPIEHKGTEPEGIAIGNELGVRFEGIQEGIEELPDQFTFTDPQTGSTFLATTLEGARTRLASMRAKFAEAAPVEGVTPRVTEQLKDLGWTDTQIQELDASEISSIIRNKQRPTLLTPTEPVVAGEVIDATKVQGATEALSWFHASHEDIRVLLPRNINQIKTLNNIGTWVTGNAEQARKLFGPKVFETKVKDVNLLIAHTDNFDEFFYSNKNLFKDLFPNEDLNLLDRFKEKGLSVIDNRIASMRTEYLQAFRKSIEDAGFEGIIWKNSRIDLTKGDAPHDVVVFFNKEPLEVTQVPTQPPVTPEVAVAEAPAPEGASKRVFDRIVTEPAEPNIIQKVKKGYNSFQVQMVDDLYNLKKTVEVFTKGGVELSIEEDPYVAARLLKGITGKVNTFLEQGTFGKKFWKTEKGRAVPNYTGESLESILREVREPSDWQDFSTYMVARRTVELTARDIETGINIDDANNAITDLESKHKNFPDLAKRLNKYQDSLLVYSQEMGLISNELLGKLRKNADYVPFYRVFNELQSRGFMGKKMADIANPIKRIKGSEREIINPLESIVKNTYVMISAADRNNVGIMLANLVNQNPEMADVFERVPTPITKVAQTSAKELGVEIEGMTEADMEQVIDIFRPSFFVPGNEVTVLVDGKKQFYRVDKDLRDALLNLTREDIGMMGKILSAPAKWLRAGAILSPDFMARNPARDQLSAFVFSNYGFLPGIDFLRGIGSILKKDADYELFRSSGAEHAMMVSMDREYLQKSFKEITEGKKFTSYIKHPIEILRLGSEFGERATRLGEFKKGIARGATPTQAGLAAREVTLDFAKAGTIAHALNRYIPFFNANIRGWDKMITSFQEHPTRTAAKVFMGITLTSMLFYLVNREDERWDEIPQWQKDLFWIVFIPGQKEPARIPKPFEMGILFGSIPERFLEYLDKKDPTMLKDVLLSAAETGSPGFIPQAILPIIENLSNFNFFKGREIVPPSRQDLPPELQYTRYTTTVSKEVGKLINVSPAKIDNLINAWTGGLGRYATNILDAILEGMGISPKLIEPSPTLADIPVLKAFVVRDPFGAQNESVNRFYEKLEDYQKNENALKQFLKTGDIIKFNELKEKHPELLFFYDLENDVAYSASARYLRRVARDLSALRKKQDEVFNSTTMTPEMKRKLINEIDRLKVGVAKRALDLFPAEGPVVLEKQLFDASNQLGDVLNDVPLLSREKPDIYNMRDLSSDYKETLKAVTLADLEGKKIPKTVSAWYDKEESLATHETFPNIDLVKINNDPAKGFILEDYISQWQERQLITDPEELREHEVRFTKAHLGNLTPEQISALRDYHALSGDEQELFLEGHPELREDPRDEWLKDNPEDNARLAIWGQANILTQEAYDIAQKMIKDLKLPLKALSDFSLPPKESVESHFKYLDTVREFSGNSAEARRILAGDDAYRAWKEGVTIQELEPLDTPIPLLDLQIKSRPLDEDFEAKETDEERATFKETHTEWWDDQRRIQAMRNEGSELNIREWVERGHKIDEFDDASAEALVWLLDHLKTYQWAIDRGMLSDRLDELREREPILRIDVKWRTQDDAYDAIQDPNDRTQTQLRQNYLDANSEYAKQRRVRDALGIRHPDDFFRKFPTEQIDSYVRWYTDEKLQKPDDWDEKTFQNKWYEDEWYLMGHDKFYQAMLDFGVFNERRDYRLVPTRGVFAKWLHYNAIRNNQAERDQYRLDNPDLDEWGSQKQPDGSVFIWTRTMSEKRRRAGRTAGERTQEEVEERLEELEPVVPLE